MSEELHRILLTLENCKFERFLLTCQESRLPLHRRLPGLTLQVEAPTTEPAPGIFEDPLLAQQLLALGTWFQSVLSGLFQLQVTFKKEYIGSSIEKMLGRGGWIQGLCGFLWVSPCGSC